MKYTNDLAEHTYDRLDKEIQYDNLEPLKRNLILLSGVNLFAKLSNDKTHEYIYILGETHSNTGLCADCIKPNCVEILDYLINTITSTE